MLILPMSKQKLQEQTKFKGEVKFCTWESSENKLMVKRLIKN